MSNAPIHRLEVDESPVYLYRYYSFKPEHEENAQKIFVENEIYIPNPNSFNDPFDCKLEMNYVTAAGWRTWLNEWLKRTRPYWNRSKRQEVVSNILRKNEHKGILKKLFSDIINDVGILCFSQYRDDLMLWSHYANSHKGFCLEFNRFTDFWKDVLPVKYETEYPKIDFVSSTDFEQAQITFLTKAECWSHEKEWRLVEYRNGSGPHMFPPETLTGVIFGCRMTEGNKDKIIKWVREGKTTPTLYQAVKKKREFGLAISKL